MTPSVPSVPPPAALPLASHDPPPITTDAMAPTPTPPKQNEPIPKLHLRVLDLSHPGCSRFFSHTSDPYSILLNSSKTVLFALYPPSLRSSLESPFKEAEQLSPPVRSVTLHIRDLPGVAYTTGSLKDDDHKEVHFSTTYIQNIGGDSKRIKQEIEGVVVHELVHVYQYNGKGTVPGGLIEGIADWVRLGAGLGPPHWKKGGGEKWDQGYDATAFFLDWISNHLLDSDFVPKLNFAMKDKEWEDGKLMSKLMGGKSVEEMWKKYKKEMADESSDAPPAVPTHTAKVGGGYNVGYSG